jgi:Right handed beta helix region
MLSVSAVQVKGWRRAVALCAAVMLGAGLFLAVRSGLPHVAPRDGPQPIPAAGSTAAKAYYVATNGDDAAAGTLGHPWRTLERALAVSRRPRLRGGETLYLRGGVYRFDEGRMSPPGAVPRDALSGRPGQPTVISNYPGETPLIYLSARMEQGWKRYQARPAAAIWYADWNGYVRTNHPWLYRHGDVVALNSVHPGAVVPQQVAIDGRVPRLLQEVNSAANAREPTHITSVRTNENDMIAGDFYYENKRANPDYGRLFVWLPDGSNPNGQPIEVGLDRFLNLGLQHDVHVSGLSIRYSNMEALNLSGNRNLFDRLDLSYNAFLGIIGAGDSCVLENSTVSWNGMEGSGLQGEGTRYEGNLFANDNYRRYSAAWHCGGVKLIPHIRNMVIRRNTFRNIVAGPGLWLDTMGDGHIIEGNRFVSAQGKSSGLMIEASDGSAQHPIIIRNNLFEGPGVFVAASSYVYIFNNDFTWIGAQIHGLQLSRTTASHDRVENNIFYLPQRRRLLSVPVFIVRAPPPYHTEDNVSNYNLFWPAPGARMLFGGDLQWRNGISWPQWRAEGFDADSLIADPKLTDPAHGVFTLQPDSPAIGAGLVTPYVTNDFFGTPRIGRNDIGACQAASTR